MNTTAKQHRSKPVKFTFKRDIRTLPSTWSFDYETEVSPATAKLMELAAARAARRNGK